ncbi:hypothetical protein HO173_013205 [Letharia columbiana]|uniref:Uncharacterized protein n=1 Tax=Letharia columbiana TaxID=112416 RepID=A0A8H6CID6_9LECA|nr:uncharacterized protein HO173_013205 [Letharia columbiana]KAF6223779.1 hypothetical protein HO173_013205 [Letharia columbiana]
MCEDRERRTTNAPLDMGAVYLLAETLTDLVEEVCFHNRDIYEGSSWNRNQEPNEPERERNLYAYLIGNPPFNPSLLLWMRDHFIIDRLRAFPADVGRSLSERLTTIKENIDEWDADDMPASRAYAGRIEDMLHEHVLLLSNNPKLMPYVKNTTRTDTHSTHEMVQLYQSQFTHCEPEDDSLPKTQTVSA